MTPVIVQLAKPVLEVIAVQLCVAAPLPMESVPVRLLSGAFAALVKTLDTVTFPPLAMKAGAETVMVDAGVTALTVTA